MYNSYKLPSVFNLNVLLDDDSGNRDILETLVQQTCKELEISYA